MAAKRIIDWDAIERDYRAGIKTLREIAIEHGITHGAINNHRKEHEWIRDLSARIKLKAAQLVSNALLSKEMSKQSKLSESDIIKSSAELQAGAILQESEEIKRLSSIAETFEEELKLISMNEEPIDLEKRTRILKSLTDVREKIINLRRRNLGINDNANGEADKSGHNDPNAEFLSAALSKLNAAASASSR